MRQVPLDWRDINIAVNGCSGFATSTQKGPFMAMLISRFRGTYLIAWTSAAYNPKNCQIWDLLSASVGQCLQRWKIDWNIRPRVSFVVARRRHNHIFGGTLGTLVAMIGHEVLGGNLGRLWAGITQRWGSTFNPLNTYGKLTPLNPSHENTIEPK